VPERKNRHLIGMRIAISQRPMKSGICALKALLFCGLLLGSTLVYAQASGSCTPVDLRSRLPHIRNQGNMGWCFANAAADLLSYHYRDQISHDPRFRGEGVSAIYAAFSYNQWFSFSEFMSEGGAIGAGVVATLGNGFCPQWQDDQAMTKGLGQLKLKEKLKYLSELKELYNDGKIQELNNRLDELEKKESIVSLVPRAELFRVMSESSDREFPMNFANLVCGPYKIQPDHLALVMNYKKIRSFTGFAENLFRLLVQAEPWDSHLIRRIDEQLDQENIVGISYFSSMLTELNGKKDGPHASVIVGRRYNDKTRQCEYIVRNSWGTGNPGYKHPSEGGSIFVGEDILSRNLYRVTFITPYRLAEDRALYLQP